jgi:hypothetical protein
MKKKFAVGLVITLAITINVTIALANSTGPVSYWPFDEGTGTTAYDAVNDNDGTIYEATWSTSDYAPVASNVASLQFDGFNDYVGIPDSDSLDTGTQFTIAAWFKTDDVDKVDPKTESKTQTIVMYGWDPADGKNNPLHIRDYKLYLAIRGYGGGLEDLVGVTDIVSNQWYHVAVTYDGTTATMYLNGTVEVSQAATMDLNTDSRMTIGRYQNPLNENLYYHFDGLIDEVGLWNRALSAEEVAWLASEVDIDIKPGSDPNSINLGSNGVIPVAILSSESFDATQVDPDTVTLAGAEVAVRGKGNRSLAHHEDVNGDGLLDLVVQVETENLDSGAFQDGTAILTGETFGGRLIQGQDEIVIVPPE